MIVRRLGALVALAVGALVAGALLLFSNLDRALVLDVYLVFAGAVALQALARETSAATRAAWGSELEAALRRSRGERGRPEALRRLEGLVVLASATAGDFHLGLRQRLREAAAHRLQSRLGIDLEREPERAARVLGPDAWALLRGDREAPADRFAPGPELGALARAVGAIERISA